MTYCQKDFSQTIGNTDITIAEGGALIIAFTNLIERFGYTIEPTDISELQESLSWSSVSYLEPAIGISKIQQPNECTIHQFLYKGVDGQSKTTYAITDPEDFTKIIDSYDGLSKDAAIYGEIVASTTYEKYPVLPSSYSKPLVAPIDVTPNTYEVITVLNGYGSSTDAMQHINPLGEMPLGGFYVFDQLESAINLTNDLAGPGWWINILDNIKPIAETSIIEPEPIIHIGNDDPDPVIPLTPTEIKDIVALDVEEPKDTSVSVPVRIVPADPDKWQSSWIKFLNVVNYKAAVDTIITDLANEQPNKAIKVGTTLPVAGKFEKDGITYLRTAKSVQDGHWYGIPDNTARVIEEEDDIDSIYNRAEPTSRDKAIKAAATAEGKVKNIFNNFGKKK